MVVQLELTDDEVDRMFRALADATRRDILRRTMGGEASVSQLAATYDMSF
ncbi:MAG: Transcriptional regulator, ArsR family, partial [uncultured Nocardioidaceae bacterium]